MPTGDATTATRSARTAAWVVIPLLGAWWHAHNLRGTWWFFDDWSVIDRVLRVPLRDGLLGGFNGHFWVVEFLVYRVQVHTVGIDSHRFVALCYVAVLAALVVALAAVLRAGGTPTLVSLGTAVVVTYLGVGAQNMLFAVQVAPMLAIAVCLAATAVALRFAPGRLAVAVVGGALLLSVGCDSGYALTGILLATVAVWRSWPGRARLAVVPAIVAVATWHLVGDLGPRWPGTVGRRAAFAVDLVLHTLGALVGRAIVAGTVLAIVTVVLIGLGLRSGHVTGAARTLLYAGGAASVLAVGALAQARADLVGRDFASSNRYLQNTAVPLVVALVPALAASLRGLSARLLAGRSPGARAGAAAIAPVVVALAFAGGLGPLRAYRAEFVAANGAVRDAVRSTVVVVVGGCPFGTDLDPASQPAGAASPQLTTGLVVDLVAAGALTPVEGADADPAVVERICRAP